MAYQCPECGQEFEIKTEFCPACGKPMDPEAHRIAMKNEAVNSRLLTVKWYKFLIWFSIPVSILMLFVNLGNAITMLTGFDDALYKPELLHLVRISLYMDLTVQTVLVPLMGYTEYALIRKKWVGVRLLLLIYGLQAVYAAAGAVLLLLAKADVSSVIVSIVQMVFMLCVNRVYFNKRRSMFE